MFSAPRCKEPSLVHSGKPLRGGRTFRKMFQDWEAWDEQAQENWKSKYFRKGKPWWLPFCQQREQADFQRQAWEQTRHCSFHIIERKEWRQSTHSSCQQAFYIVDLGESLREENVRFGSSWICYKILKGQKRKACETWAWLGFLEDAVSLLWQNWVPTQDGGSMQ